MTNDELATILANAANLVPPGSKWEHYKGSIVTIVTLCLDEHDLTPQVVYLHDWLTFCRPLRGFTSSVYVDDKWVPRFRRIDQ